MALPRFSFSGWTSQSLAPKVNPASIPIATPPAGQLVAQTNAANTNLPAWLQDSVNQLNAAQALRTQMAGQVMGAPAAPPAFDPNLGVAAVTNARANYNQQVFGMNERARLANLVQQRNLMSSPNAFGFNNPMDVSRQIGLDRQIEDYQRFNLPTSGWVGGGGGGRYSNGLLNGTGYA